MKVVDLKKRKPSVADLIILAGKQNILLKSEEGREFVLAELDEFAAEVAQVRRNKDLMRLLKQRSKEKTTYSLAEVKKNLGLH